MSQTHPIYMYLITFLTVGRWQSFRKVSLISNSSHKQLSRPVHTYEYCLNGIWSLRNVHCSVVLHCFNSSLWVIIPKETLLVSVYFISCKLNHFFCDVCSMLKIHKTELQNLCLDCLRTCIWLNTFIFAGTGRGWYSIPLFLLRLIQLFLLKRYPE